MTSYTPLHPLKQIGKELGVDLWVKRDDLCTVPGGGSKLRKMKRILDAAPPLTDSLITNGGTQSNHARVVAILAAQRGLKAHLILHGNPKELENPRGNLLLMLLAGAEVQIVPPEEIGVSLEATFEELRTEGFHPYLIEGGGHSLEGALALANAVEELASQCSTREWIPDFIIHASGTGGTQAGILAGLDLVGWPTEVIGISVARGAERGSKIVSDLYTELRTQLKISRTIRRVDFRDNWVGSGYGKALPEARCIIQKVCTLEGLPLDPTYTSKAMVALFDLVNDGIIPKGAKVLFWHTGGLLNLLSADLDWMDFE